MSRDADIRLVDFVEAVMERPAMYTRGGTYAEALAYLDGSMYVARSVGEECQTLHLTTRESLERYAHFLACSLVPDDRNSFLKAYRAFCKSLAASK